MLTMMTMSFLCPLSIDSFPRNEDMGGKGDVSVEKDHDDDFSLLQETTVLPVFPERITPML